MKIASSLNFTQINWQTTWANCDDDVVSRSMLRGAGAVTGKNSTGSRTAFKLEIKKNLSMLTRSLWVVFSVCFRYWYHQSNKMPVREPPPPANSKQIGVTKSLLYNGSKFQGFQKSKGNSYTVEVVLQVSTLEYNECYFISGQWSRIYKELRARLIAFI